MTVQEAASKWRCSTYPILQRLKEGKIPGAKRVPYPHCRDGRWDIPDDAPNPGIGMRCLTDPPDGSPAECIWKHQDKASIGELAAALNLTNNDVVALYDKACRKYLHGEEDRHVPQES